MTSDISTNGRPRSLLPVRAPAGATAASFTLFISVAALLAMLYLAGEWYNLTGAFAPSPQDADLSGRFGFPTDAGWVRAVFARNVASGYGLSFNPGAPVAGVTGVAWIGILAAVSLVLGESVLVAKALGIICVLLSAFLVWQLVLSYLGDWRFAFLAALLVAASPRLASEALSGNEAAPTAFLLLAAIHWQGLGWEGPRRQRVIGAIAAGLAALCRPELILLLPLLFVDRWLVAFAYRKKTNASYSAIRRGILRSFPELAGAALILIPYLLFNSRTGGPLWQQPVYSLHLHSPLAWPTAVLSKSWLDNPLLLCVAVIGLPVAALAGARSRSMHSSFLLVLAPCLFLLAPGFIWPRADLSNAAYTAAYLTPLVAILGSAGLFLLHRLLGQAAAQVQKRAVKLSFAAGIGAICVALAIFSWMAHGRSWQEHGYQVKKVNDLNGYIGRWAGSHLAPDAAIATREVGAIGFFSHRRMVDLGGTINREGLDYLSRPGSKDSNLLAFLEKEQPSHLAIRSSDFPDLSQRADLLTAAITCVVTNPFTGGESTMTLYETPWPAPSTRQALSGSGSPSRRGTINNY